MWEGAQGRWVSARGGWPLHTCARARTHTIVTERRGHGIYSAVVVHHREGPGHEGVVPWRAHGARRARPRNPLAEARARKKANHRTLRRVGSLVDSGVLTRQGHAHALVGRLRRRQATRGGGARQQHRLHQRARGGHLHQAQLLVGRAADRHAATAAHDAQDEAAHGEGRRGRCGGCWGRRAGA